MEGIEEKELRDALEKFGHIKDIEMVRNRACAFVEFETLEAARDAIITSLHKSQGGDGGVIVSSKGGNFRVSVETKKERGERQVGRPRGGGPGQGVNGSNDGRGGYRGRGGSRGRGPKA